MQQYYTFGNTFFKDARRTSKSSLNINFKSEKHKWNAKEKELITKYRKGLIWKDIN